ncbi:MAG: ATP synthase F1 subunit delta [Flavobacteriales bacterium]|nr:ATP synthase F1 subunit delta [Flavobacteriales bacterium]
MSRAAVRYAKAILELANQNGTTDKVNSDMTLMQDAWKQSKDLQVFLTNPVIKQEMKRNALLEVFPQAQKETNALFELLYQNKRFDILFAVTQKFQELLLVQNGIVKAIVTTAIPMTAELEKQVLEKAKQMTSHQVVLDHKVDESIIGGFILRVGDQQLNASVASRLQEIKREIIN